MLKAALLITITIILTVSAYSQRQYAIYETSSGNKINVSELAQKTLSSDIIFFGEFHDDSLIHAIQFDYLNEIYKLNSHIAVSMEMFERDNQAALDNYLSGKSTEEEFMKAGKPWSDYKMFYRPLVELAKSNKCPVIAANIPRKYAALYSSEGWSGIERLPQNERPLVAANMNLKENQYEKNFNFTMMHNMGLDSNAQLNPNQENTMFLYYGAQCIKDETMAESIVNFLEKNKGMKVVHFNGDFHSNNYLGTVEKVLDRSKSYKISVIAPTYSEHGKKIEFNPANKPYGDFVIVVEEKPSENMEQMMMGGHLSENYITSHKVKIKLEPAKHYLIGQDLLKFKNPIVKKSSFKILKSVKVTDVSSPDGDFDYTLNNDSLYQEVIIKNKNKEINEISISYKGEIYNSPNITLLNQRHSNTPGIISDTAGEGIYLPGGSYCPQANTDLADFDIEVTLPKELTLITSGSLVSTNEENGNKIFHYKSELPAEEFILVGGKYTEFDSTYDGKKFSIYVFEKNQYTQSYLNASINYYILYTKLLGPYPYGSFKIVENFFATGFGMPGYTLLSNKLMALPWVLLDPGSLAHEFVHNWWGNSVYVDENYGNWCEALTSFCANYYFNSLTNRKDKQIEWRKKALMSMEALPPKSNYPVNKFKGQVNNDDATIGYQKGGFLFYELYKIFGDEKFFSVLRNFAQKYKGKRASWISLSMLFDQEATKDSLNFPGRTFFHQWLNETKVPALKMVDVSQGGDNINFNITQDLKCFMQVPVRLTVGKDTTWKTFTISDNVTKCSMKAPAGIKKLSLDPDYQCLRRLNKWEIPYSFSLTLSDNPLLIMPSKSSPDFKAAAKFADMLKESDYKVDAKSVDDLKAGDWENRSLIVLGDEKSNDFYKNMAGNYPKGIKISGKQIVVDRQVFMEEGNLLLLNCSNPKNNDKYVSIIYSGNMDSPDQFRRLFHYLSYSMVIVSQSKPGKPISDREFFPESKDRQNMEIDLK